MTKLNNTLIKCNYSACRIMPIKQNIVKGLCMPE